MLDKMMKNKSNTYVYCYRNVRGQSVFNLCLSNCNLFIWESQWTLCVEDNPDRSDSAMGKNYEQE